MALTRPDGGFLTVRLVVILFGGLVLAPSEPSGVQLQRVVEIGDENRDGLYKGDDVERALDRCRPGCLLRAGAQKFDDVAVVIDKRFTESLVIEGAGIGGKPYGTHPVSRLESDMNIMPLSCSPAPPVLRTQQV